MIALYVQK